MTHSIFHLTFHECRALLRQRLAERPARIQLLVGPRQVGKTTLLLSLEKTLGPRSVYAAGDGPEAALPGFWERTWARAEEIANEQRRCVVLFDEVQHVEDWSSKLKSEWDRLRRRKANVHVVASGSSSLLLARGSAESLAGRFERLTLTHWPARALAEAFRVSRDQAAKLVITHGGYPGAFRLRKDRARWLAYVRDAIVEPAIGRDILALAPVRRPALLRQLFAVATANPAQIVSLQKLQGQLQDAGALETLSHYLKLLEDGFLVAGIEKWSEAAIRRRAAPPKLITLDNALLAVADPREAPQPGSERFGAWLENACLAHAYNRGQRITYWREEPLDVDAVIEGSWGKWAVEVKSGRFTSHDLRGLLEFTRRHPSLRPLVICDDAGVSQAERAGVPGMPWERFLLDGLGND